VLQVFKSALITPLLNKPDLDSTDTRSYRPISNLPVVLKLLERIVFRQLYSYLSAADLPRMQSAYRTHHSTETAVLKVLTDILYAVDDGNLSVLALLDLSAAFDTVDHDILLTRPKVFFSIKDAALDWFQSYLTSRVECVRRGSARSAQKIVRFGVPHATGVCPGPSTVYIIHCRLHRPYRGIWFSHSPVCRRHADTGLLSPWVCRAAPVHPVFLPERSVELDAVKLSPVEHCED